MASISPGSSIIEELVVAAADSIPEGKEDGVWRALRKAFAVCLPLAPIIYLALWKLGYL
ncbi:MAG: hypothetical protein ACPHIE_03835 [Candidatus Thalassarchaeaceae archaeon]|jgi:hypothetical protein